MSKTANDYFLLGYLHGQKCNVDIEDVQEFSLNGSETQEDIINMANDYLSDIQTERAESKAGRHERFEDYYEEEAFNHELYG